MCRSPFLQQSAAWINGDRVAQALLQNGNRFGRQHVVFHSKHSYPSYVVRYRMSSDAAAATLPVIRAKCSGKYVSVSVAGKHVYKANPRTPEDVFVIMVVNLNTLKTAKAAIFNIHKVSGAKAMIELITALGTDDIVAVAGSKRCIPSKRSQMVIDVLQSLRSVGGSMHMLDCPYVLVGSKRPHVLNGLVHEDHQPDKAAVIVDMRVILHNRNTTTFNVQKCNSTDADDMVPVCWQFQDASTSHGVMWQELRGCSTQLTVAYQDGQLRTRIDDHTVDLVKMKTRGFKIRCLNWKGEILPPLGGSLLLNPAE